MKQPDRATFFARWGSLLLLALFFASDASAQQTEPSESPEPVFRRPIAIGTPSESFFSYFQDSTLIEEVRYPCSFLGIQGSDAAPEVSERTSDEPEIVRGALVHEIIPGTGAESAGLREGDLIISYNGESVHGIMPLRRRILDTEPGTSVRLEVIREGVGLSVTAILGNRNPGMPCEQPDFAGRFAPSGFEHLQFRLDSLRARFGAMTFNRTPSADGFFWADSVRGRFDSSVVSFFGLRSGLASELSMFDSCRSRSIYFGGGDTSFSRLFRRLDFSDRKRLGIVLQSIPDQLAEYFQVPAGDHGVLVSEVHAEGRAADAGFRAGDVIIEVNGRSVSGPVDVMQAQTGEGDVDTFVIVRDGKIRQLEVERRLEELPEEDLD